MIDPAPAVARQVKRVLEGLSLSNTADSAGETIFLTSAEPHRFEILLQELVEINATVKGLHWNENDLIE